MFLQRRMRRVRSRTIQPLLCETILTRNDLVAPLFVDETAGAPVPIGSMPGQSRYPIDGIAAVAGKFWSMASGRSSFSASRLTRTRRQPAPTTPEGLCSRLYGRSRPHTRAWWSSRTSVPASATSHGHCGIVGDSRCGGQDLLNDESLLLMNKIAVSHAEAGADIVAPSCMLDGMVRSIRTALDEDGYEEVLILSVLNQVFLRTVRPVPGSGRVRVLVWRPHHLPDEPGKWP